MTISRGLACAAFGLFGIVAASPMPSTAATAEQCKVYASNAAGHYARMRQVPKCRVANSARWNSNSAGHYKWCLTAQEDWIHTEHNARHNHLRKCTATSKPTKIDDSQ